MLATRVDGNAVAVVLRATIVEFSGTAELGITRVEFIVITGLLINAVALKAVLELGNTTAELSIIELAIDESTVASLKETLELGNRTVEFSVTEP